MELYKFFFAVSSQPDDVFDIFLKDFFSILFAWLFIAKWGKSRRNLLDRMRFGAVQRLQTNSVFSFGNGLTATLHEVYTNL